MARRSSSPLGQLLAVVSLLFAGSALAVPTEVHIIEQREVASAAPSVWVSVDTSGKATTITPTVSTVNGAVTTISPPPDTLTETGTYTLAPTSAQVTTSTGLSPVATASSSNGNGTFLACGAYTGVDYPFCQPKSGSQLNPNTTYYVTWNPAYFGDANTSVEVQGTYHDGSQEGFTSPRMLASQGFYVWAIDSAFLSSRAQVSSINVSLTLAAFEDTYGNQLDEIAGPTVVVTSTPFEYPVADPGDGGDKTNVVAIAVPVVIVVVFLALAGLCVWSWRRHGTVPVLGALRRRSTLGGGQGYGIRQSRAQRVGPGAGVVVGPDVDGGAGGSDKKVGGGIQLTDRESWSPSSSPYGADGAQTNVFREELERQERER